MKTLALLLFASALVTAFAGLTHAADCAALLRSLKERNSTEEVARSHGVPVAEVQRCRDDAELGGKRGGDSDAPGSEAGTPGKNPGIEAGSPGGPS